MNQNTTKMKCKEQFQKILMSAKDTITAPVFKMHIIQVHIIE